MLYYKHSSFSFIMFACQDHTMFTEFELVMTSITYINFILRKLYRLLRWVHYQFYVSLFVRLIMYHMLLVPLLKKLYSSADILMIMNNLDAEEHKFSLHLLIIWTALMNYSLGLYALGVIYLT